MHVFFAEDGTMEKKVFLATWKDIPAQNEVQYTIQNCECNAGMLVISWSGVTRNYGFRSQVESINSIIYIYRWRVYQNAAEQCIYCGEKNFGGTGYGVSIN